MRGWPSGRHAFLAAAGLLALAVPCATHAAITRPAMRVNKKVAGGWCQWCQGTQQFCTLGSKQCLPPRPCWDDEPGERVHKTRFGEMQKRRTPEGSFWVEEGGANSTLTWCAGDVVPIHFMIYADHNGAYRWESQQSLPGKEQEAAFKNFTPWISLSNDYSTEYFDDDGLTPLVRDRCKGGSANSASGKNWSWHLEACREHSWGRTSLKVPEDMPPGRHVFRWLWLGGLTTNGSRVIGPEPAIFVNCVDVVVGKKGECKAGAGGAATSGASKDAARTTTAPPTAEPAALPPAGGATGGSSESAANAMPTAGPPLPADSTPAQGSKGAAGVPLAEGPTALPSPEPSPAPAPSEAAAGSGGSGACACESSTAWDGAFGQFAARADSFCEQGFGKGGPYISGGGGDGSSGGASGDGPCTSGQYKFSEEEGWLISVPAAQAAKKSPYRAFAYCQFCMGKSYKECWGTQKAVTFSFSFRTEGVSRIGAYIKLLFWSDSGNILGLIPPNHPNGQGKYRLVTFIKDDYPNVWSQEVEIEDGRWYHMDVEFTPSSSQARVSLDGTPLDSGKLPVTMLSESDGPQIGVYSFDYSTEPWPKEGFKLWINNPCIGRHSGSCAAGQHEVSEGQPHEVAPAPLPRPDPTPSPAPPQQSAASTTAPPSPLEPQLAETTFAPQPQQQMAEDVGVAADGAGEQPAGGALATAPVPGACSQTWGQCGGKGWAGPTCCADGDYCAMYNNDVYHQCRPLDQPDGGSPPSAAQVPEASSLSPQVEPPAEAQPTLASMAESLLAEAQASLASAAGSKSEPRHVAVPASAPELESQLAGKFLASEEAPSGPQGAAGPAAASAAAALSMAGVAAAAWRRWWPPMAAGQGAPATEPPAPAE